jgi:hypothetical protein
MHSICEWLQHNKMLLDILGWAPFAVSLEVIHYVGVFIMVGSVVLVDLRVMGIAARRRGVGEFAAQLFPYAWVGLAMVVASGFLMFTTSAADYYSDPTFHKKMTVVVLALIAAVFIQRGAPKWESKGAIPIVAKVVALICLVLMFGSIIYGNLVPALSGIG